MTAEKPPEDEAAEFRAAMREVRRKGPAVHVRRDAPRPDPVPRQRQADDLAVLREMMADPDPDILESGDTLSYRAPGVQEAVLRKLRRGQYRVEREIDLHGHNREAARAAVAGLLGDSRGHDWRCVRIVHGKGHGSPNSGPVIKTLLAGWLRRSSQVLAFCSARPVDGGTGAVYVLLRGAQSAR